MTPKVRASLRRIVRPLSYTCRLARNHNNFVLDALERAEMIERRGGWAVPTPIGTYAVYYWEDRETEQST